MKDLMIGGGLIGFGFGILFVMTLSTLSPDSNYNLVKNARETCERTLPRDQHCVIVAVPENKDET